MPVDTYLKDSSVADYGGILAGVETLNISKGGAFHSYPPTDHSAVVYDFLNTISILDGGLFEFHGTAADGDLLNIHMNGSLMIRGGGEMIVNNLELYGEYMYFVYIVAVVCIFSVLCLEILITRKHHLK